MSYDEHARGNKYARRWDYNVGTGNVFRARVPEATVGKSVAGKFGDIQNIPRFQCQNVRGRRCFKSDFVLVIPGSYLSKELQEIKKRRIRRRKIVSHERAEIIN